VGVLKNYDLIIHPADESLKARRAELVGTLDSHTVVVFEKAVDDMLDDASVQHVHMNLDRLTFISSAGISALMHLTHRLRQRNGELVLIRPSEKVHRVFKTLGFTNIFRIVDKEVPIDATP
jgi:anti-anti-sigma factor